MRFVIADGRTMPPYLESVFDRLIRIIQLVILLHLLQYLRRQLWFFVTIPIFAFCPSVPRSSSSDDAAVRVS